MWMRTNNQVLKEFNYEPENKNQTESIRSQPGRQVGREDRKDRQGHRRRGQRTHSAADAEEDLHGEPLDLREQAREQFELSTCKRILDIYSSTPKTIDALMKLELPSGVEVEIKV